MITNEAIQAVKEVTGMSLPWNDRHYEALQMALSALEKQIPKKVRITTSTKRCATCGRQLSGIGNIHPERRYCQRCGQAIDWEDET